MYNKIFFTVLGLIILAFFVLPFLLSSKSMELTGLGILIIIAIIHQAGKLLLDFLNKGHK